MQGPTQNLGRIGSTILTFIEYKQTIKHPDTQAKYIEYCLIPKYKILALEYTWEPSAANITKSYSSRLAALERFDRETNFRYIKVDPLNLESQNEAKNMSVGLPSSLIKIWGKSV